MWCLVSQPNGVVLDVEVDHKAKGQQCLEKVSSSLCLYSPGPCCPVRVGRFIRALSLPPALEPSRCATLFANGVTLNPQSQSSF